MLTRVRIWEEKLIRPKKYKRSKEKSSPLAKKIFPALRIKDHMYYLHMKRLIKRFQGE